MADDDVRGRQTVSAKSNSYHIRDLKPDTEYNVTVVASGNHGSTASLVARMKTNPGGSCHCTRAVRHRSHHTAVPVPITFNTTKIGRGCIQEFKNRPFCRFLKKMLKTMERLDPICKWDLHQNYWPYIAYLNQKHD